MMNFTINLTSLAVILWSGMLIIAGSIWILASQVRKLADIVEQQAKFDQNHRREFRSDSATTTGERPRERVLKLVERSTSRAN